jgi:hypothetical protein
MFARYSVFGRSMISNRQFKNLLLSANLQIYDLRNLVADRTPLANKLTAQNLSHNEIKVSIVSPQTVKVRSVSVECVKVRNKIPTKCKVRNFLCNCDQGQEFVSQKGQECESE